MTHHPTSFASTGLLDPDDLAARLTGAVLTPDNPDWDAARQAWNLTVDQRPDLVVLAETADDVAETVAFARAAGLRVAPQGTGHGACVRADLDRTILLRTDRMRTVTVDADARTVRVEAGVLWGEVAAALAPHGLVGLAGSSADVGVVGYLLGGGYSWFARRYGLGCSSVTAIELVTGDGITRRVDAQHETELFWAMRGGAGNGAVVTAVELLAYPVATVYAGALLFPIERAREVLTAYEQWTRDLDEAASTCVRLLRIPPIPDIPEPFRGRAFVGIDGAIDLPPDLAAELLAPLRALGPEIDLFSPMPASGLSQIHMDPPQPSPARGDGLILDELTVETIDVLLAAAGPDAQCPLLAIDLRHMGGAVARPAPGGGAVDHLPGRFLLFAVGITPTPDAEAAVVTTVEALKSVLSPWTSAGDYLNFRETSDAASRFYPPNVLERLLAVLREYDPDGVVRAGQDWAS